MSASDDTRASDSRTNYANSTASTTRCQAPKSQTGTRSTRSGRVALTLQSEETCGARAYASLACCRCLSVRWKFLILKQRPDLTLTQRTLLNRLEDEYTRSTELRWGDFCRQWIKDNYADCDTPLPPPLPAPGSQLVNQERSVQSTLTYDPWAMNVKLEMLFPSPDLHGALSWASRSVGPIVDPLDYDPNYHNWNRSVDPSITNMNSDFATLLQDDTNDFSNFIIPSRHIPDAFGSQPSPPAPAYGTSIGDFCMIPKHGSNQSPLVQIPQSDLGNNDTLPSDDTFVIPNVTSNSRLLAPNDTVCTGPCTVPLGAFGMINSTNGDDEP